METDIIKLSSYLSNILESVSTEFKFRNHTNNCSNRKNDNFYDSDLCKNIKNTISCKDLFYFSCMQSKNNESYQIINTMMTQKNITNVTDSAYKKQRVRKSYLMFQQIYYRLYKYELLSKKK